MGLGCRPKGWNIYFWLTLAIIPSMQINLDFGVKRAHCNGDRNASSKRPVLQFNLTTGTRPGHPLCSLSSWQQAAFVEKGGWATLPGSDLANSSVARACADMLDNLK